MLIFYVVSCLGVIVFFKLVVLENKEYLEYVFIFREVKVNVYKKF